MGLEIKYLDGGSSLVKSNEKRKAYINAIQLLKLYFNSLINKTTFEIRKVFLMKRFFQ
ncbi:MAG: hypothetical protein RL762_1414 [Bacteroidota bacterium]|jgi:hypothetical protein